MHYTITSTKNDVKVKPVVIQRTSSEFKNNQMFIKASGNRNDYERFFVLEKKGYQFTPLLLNREEVKVVDIDFSVGESSFGGETVRSERHVSGRGKSERNKLEVSDVKDITKDVIKEEDEFDGRDDDFDEVSFGNKKVEKKETPKMKSEVNDWNAKKNLIEANSDDIEDIDDEVW